MKPEPLPIVSSQEHGAEYVDMSLFISAGFYFNVMEWETEELAGLYPTTVRLFQGNREGPRYRLPASLESMCRGDPPPPPPPGLSNSQAARGETSHPAWEPRSPGGAEEKVARASSWTAQQLLSKFTMLLQYYTLYGCYKGKPVEAC